jgi:hypothetical protein
VAGSLLQIRPPNQRELDGGAKNIVVTAETAEKVRLDAAGAGTKPQHFIYDFAIEAEASQEAVFSRIGVPIVQDAFHGYNSTVRRRESERGWRGEMRVIVSRMFDAV